MKYLDILVGPMASGKSTYCSKAAKQGAIIVCDDDITMMVHGGNYGLYTIELIPLYKAIENSIIQMGLSLNHRVIKSIVPLRCKYPFNLFPFML